MAYAGQSIIKVTNNTDKDLSDFQVKLTLNSDNFKYWSLLRDDGIDVYFTLSDGTTEVPFWRELFDKTNKQAIFWIKVPAIAAKSSVTLLMHFGNLSETTDRSDGTRTFELFDDFKSLDSWTVLTNDNSVTSATIEDMQLKLTSSSQNTCIYVSREFTISSTSDIGYMIGTRVRRGEDTGSSVGVALIFGNSDISSGYLGGFFNNISDSEFYIGKIIDQQCNMLMSQPGPTFQHIICTIEFGWYSNQLVLRNISDNVSVTIFDTDSPLNSSDHIAIGAGYGTWMFDHVYVRKYITNASDMSQADPTFDPLTATIDSTALFLVPIEAALVYNTVLQYVDTFISDGIITKFTLNHKPIIPKVQVFVNNSLIDPAYYTVDYTNGIVELKTSPPNGSIVEIVYYAGDFEFMPNVPVKVYRDDLTIDTCTTDNRGRYTLRIPKYYELQIRADTTNNDSITVIKWTDENDRR